MKNTSGKTKYFLYARKSSESEDRQAASIDDQIKELTRVAREYNLNVVETFSESQSAKEPGRPVFNQMIRRLYTGEADGVLCWKLDRLARNFVDGGAIIDLLQSGKMQSIRTHEKFYLPSDNVLVMAMEFGMANQFVRDLSVNVKRGLKNKAEKGWLPGIAPIGYRSTAGREKGFKEIEIDPERFHLVRQVFDLMLTGNYSVLQIWHKAKEMGLTTIKRKKVGGGLISRNGVYSLLSNSFYYGSFEYPVGSGNWIQGKHKPIITAQEFDRVQSLLGRKGRPRPKKHVFAFTGMMRCGSCGSSITAETKTKRQKNGNVHNYVYYHCTKRKDADCVERSIEIKDLKAQIDEVLSSITISERFRDWAIKYLHELRRNEAETHEVVLQNRNKELESVNARISQLMLTYSSLENKDGSIMSATELKEIKGDLQKQKIALEEGLKQGSVEMDKWVELTEQAFDFARYARVWFEHGDEETKKAILGCLGSNLIVKDQKLNVHLHPFFLSVLESKEKVEAQVASARTSQNTVLERHEGTFVPSCPDLLRG